MLLSTHNSMWDVLLSTGISSFRKYQCNVFFRMMTDLISNHVVQEENVFRRITLRCYRAISVRRMLAKSYQKYFDINVKKEREESGTGIYKSDTAAPFMIVSPSQWESIGFETHHTGKLV